MNFCKQIYVIFEIFTFYIGLNVANNSRVIYA
jgi:hypothetical protein